MHTNNPILSRKDAFEPSRGQQFPGYDPRMQQGVQDPQRSGPGQPQQTGRGRMTLDDVVTKTGVTLLAVIFAAAAAFLLLPPQLLFPALILSGLVTFVTSLIVAFRRSVAAPVVLFFAAFEGIFVGAISKVFESLYDGIVVQAILGTFVAAALTLAAYKFFNIRVTPKFQKVVMIATLAFAGAMLLNFVMAMFGANLGLRSIGFTPLAGIVSLIAVVLCVLNLVLDFDYIEQGVAMGAPADQSWKAAFGLTVTLVWLYVEILRILSYFRD